MLNSASYSFNPHAMPVYIVGLAILIGGIFARCKNKRSTVTLSFLFLCASIALWLIATAMGYLSTDKTVAMQWFKLDNFGVMFISVSTLFFTKSVFAIKDYRSVVIGYIAAFILGAVAISTDWLVTDAKEYFWGFFPVWGAFCVPVFMLFFGYMAASFVILFRRYRKGDLDAIKKNQVKYIIIGTLIGYTGSVDFLPTFNIEIYPFGFVSLLIYLSIIYYAIIKHRLMNIELIIRNTAIFAGLFLFVSIAFAGAAFVAQELLAGVLGENTKWAVLLLGITIITLGMRPLEKWLAGLTDRFLFQKKYDYRRTLREASEGMTLVTDMKKLLNFIVRVVTKNVRVKGAAIFQFDEAKDRYVLKIRRGTNRRHAGYALDKDNILVWWLRTHKEAILLDEVEDWLRSERFLRKEKGLKDRLVKIKDELEGMDAAICVPSYSKGYLIGFLVLGEKLSGDIYTQEDIHLLSTLASEAAIAVENAKNFMELQKLREKERESYVQTVLALAQTVDEKDSYTHGHLEDVAYYGMRVAEELEESSEFKAAINKEDLETALHLHDIGKIGVPDAILNKNGKLTAAEWEIMKQHCEIGARIVEPIGKLKNVGNIIKHHQEKYDGTGYPDGLKGEEIPLESRIIAVVDSYHAMTSDRPYRKALSQAVALKELRNNTGAQFDPIVVAAFVRAWEKGKINRT